MNIDLQSLESNITFTFLEFDDSLLTRDLFAASSSQLVELRNG